jgi:SAM-dependent methyltransferase
VDSILKQNQTAWNQAASRWVGKTALPVWGPFAVGRDRPDLIGEIAGKTFVEIGCGSGHSIHYLIERGAAHVIGVDLSDQQIAYAQETNREAISAGKVALYTMPMEQYLTINPVDTVFSIYGIGWTVNPEQTFRNIAAYLKPGGRLVWSWEHPVYAHARCEHDQVVMESSYYDEQPHEVEAWAAQNNKSAITISTRPLSTWFQIMRTNGFEMIEFLEPAPLDIEEKHRNPQKYYSIPKASIIPATMIFVCRKV